MRPRIPPPFITVFVLVIMWLFNYLMPLKRWIASPWNFLGILCAAAGVAIGVTAVASFRRAQATINPIDLSQSSRLVTGGVFSLSRNPMYLAMTLVLVGWAIWLGTASPWILPPLFVAYITAAQIAAEERALAQLFGEEYLSYKQRVNRWLGWRG